MTDDLTDRLTDVTEDVDALVARLRAAGCVYAEDEAELLREPGPDGLSERVERRISGVPLELVLGWAGFAGLRIVVEPDVFVPRQRSLLLVAEAADRLRSGAVAVDLCCGSGAIGAALASRVPRLEVYAADIDPRAVACARRNLPPARVFQGDLYAALPGFLRGRVDVLVANAPYVPSAEVAFMPREARLYEPWTTLDGGADGLDWHRRIAVGARDWLRAGAALLIETSERQATATEAILIRAGLATHVVHDDELDATVVVGSAP